MAENDVEIKFGASIEGVQASITQVRELLQGLTEPLRAVRENLGEVAEAFVAAFAVEKINEAVEGLSRLNEEARKTSLVTGLPIDQVAAIQAAAENVGASGNEVTRAFARMGVNIAEQSSLAKRALDTLGLSFQQLRGESPVDQFEQIGAAIERMSDVSSRNAVSNALFGRSFQDLVPLFAEGKDGIEEWQNTVNETGSSLARISDDLEKTKTEMTTFGLATRGDGIDLFSEFRGVIDGVYEGITDLAEAFHNAMAEGGALKDAIDGVVIVLKTLETAIVVVIDVVGNVWHATTEAVDEMGLVWLHLGDLLRELWASIGAGIGNFFSGLVAAAKDAVAQIGGDFANLGAVISSALHGDFGGAKDAFGKLTSDSSDAAAKIRGDFAQAVSGFDFSDAKGEFSGFIEDSKERWRQYTKELVDTNRAAAGVVDTIWNDTAKSTEPPKQTNNNKFAPGGGDKGAKDATAAQIAADNEEVTSAQNVYKSKSELLNAELKDKQINTSQWLAGTLDALRQELASEEDALNKELAIGNLSARQKQEIEAKKLKFVQDELKAEEDAQIKAAQSAQKQWQSATNEINSAITGQVSAVLKGSENIGQAFERVLGSLIEDVTKFFIDWALKAAESFAAQKLGITSLAAAQQAASGVQAAAAGAGAAATAAAAKPGILAQITADSGEAFAGFAAFFAPTLGPAAPAAAAGLAGEVQAQAVGLASFDIGSWSVPHDMTANIHAGETIVPAAGGFADAFRSAVAGGGGFGGGGDTHNHFYGALMDAASVTRAVVQHQNANPSARPSF